MEPAVPQANETFGNSGASCWIVDPYCEPWAMTRLYPCEAYWRMMFPASATTNWLSEMEICRL